MLRYSTIICIILFSSYVHIPEVKTQSREITDQWGILLAPSRGIPKNANPNKIKNVPEDTCPFCIDVKKKDGKTRNIFIERSKHTFAILNLYPYKSGHVLLIPYQHVDLPEKLPEKAQMELMKKTIIYTAALLKAFNTNSINIVVNIGPHSGASIPNHYHIHLIPRTRDDATGLHVAAGVTVIDQDPNKTCKILQRIIHEEEKRLNFQGITNPISPTE